MRRSWMRQHETLEKLNLQSHHNASTNSDEFVMENVLTYDKLEVLLRELLSVEAWVENVLPKLLPHLTQRNSLRVYFVVRPLCFRRTSASSFRFPTLSVSPLSPPPTVCLPIAPFPLSCSLSAAHAPALAVTGPLPTSHLTLHCLFLGALSDVP
jgi:hypothetical protein